MTHFTIRQCACRGMTQAATAVCNSNQEACFSGDGRSIAEALGACIIANREALGVTFDVIEPDGTRLASTVYGKSRINRP